MTSGAVKKKEGGRGAARRGYHHGDLARALLDEAGRALREGGPDALSLRALARALGVDAAAPYRHYASKEVLLAALAQEGFAALARAMEEAWARGGEPLQRFRRLGEAYVLFALEDGARFRLMFGPLGSGPGALPREPGASASGRTPYALLEAGLEELGAAGLARTPVRRHVLPAWSAVHGLALLLVEGPLRGTPLAQARRQARAVCDVVLAGIRP
jgi:AcrR family transcriptional regulator